VNEQNTDTRVAQPETPRAARATASELELSVGDYEVTVKAGPNAPDGDISGAFDEPTSASKVLVRDEDDRPLAVSCKLCGRLALNTRTAICCRCYKV
jgi:hypothetical protein